MTTARPAERFRRGDLRSALGSLASAAVLIAAVGSRASAQPAVRSGFWGSVGVGGALAAVRCDPCANDFDPGVSGQFRFGGTLNPSLLLGLEGNFWLRGEEDLDFLLGNLAGAIYWYPSRRGSTWFVKAGFGGMRYRVSDGDSETDDDIRSGSAGGVFGVGYDVPLAQSVSVTPYFNFVGSLFADLESGNSTLVSASVTLLQFGIGLTFH